MKIVGGDGSKFEREEWITSVVIGPSERYIVEVAFPKSGDVPLLNRIQAIDHMVGSYWAHTDTVAVIHVTTKVRVSRAPSFATLRRNEDVVASINPFRAAFERPVDRELMLTMRSNNLSPAMASMLTGINAPIDWNDGMPMINWMTTPSEITWVLRDPATQKENMDIDWRFHRGDVVKLRIFNDPAAAHAMAHPIHLHGQRFLVLKRDGVTAGNLVWKDTAIIPAGETVELLVDMSNAGRWMLHCHIAEHLSAGMMASFVVE
jgi:FtsP/CotA-like multicopper oxidase with cupredoxin domain